MNNTFSRFSLPMLWDFCEANPISEGTGGYSGAVGWVTEVIDHCKKAEEGAPRSQVICGSATEASALGKNDPFVLSKSYPHEEQDLAQCKCVSALLSTPKACKPLIPRRRLTAGTDENPSLMFGAEQNRRFCHPAVGHSW